MYFIFKNIMATCAAIKRAQNYTFDGTHNFNGPEKDFVTLYANSNFHLTTDFNKSKK